MNDAPRKNRILVVAEKLFRHYGPHKTTMADIAREAQIGVGSVYLDFPSKEAILLELSRTRVRTVAGMMRSAAEGAPPGDRLRRMLEARVAAFLILAGEGAHACDLLQCQSSQPASFDEDSRALLREELEAGIRVGELACEPESTLRVIEVAFAALSPPYLHRFERREASELAERLAALIVSGVRAARERASSEADSSSRVARPRASRRT